MENKTANKSIRRASRKFTIWKNSNRIMLEKTGNVNFRIFRKHSPENNICNLNMNFSGKIPVYDIFVGMFAAAVIIKSVKTALKLYFKIIH